LNKGSRRGLFALLLVTLAVALVGCMPSGAMSNPGWTVVTGSDEVVYAALATGRVVALNAANGQETSFFPPPAPAGSGGGGFLGGLFGGGSTSTADKPLDAVYGLPVLTDKVVLVASYDHNLSAFDRSDLSKKVWVFPVGGAVIGGATVDGGIAYFGSSDHNVYAVDASTGKSVWAKPFSTQNWIWGAPTVDAEHVYVGSMDHNVYALNRKTGEQEWAQSIGAAIPGSVALADGRLYVGAVDKKLHALSAKDGRELWATPLGHWVWGEPLVRGDTVYAGSLDGHVYAFDVATGKVRWDSVLNGAVRAGPVALDGQILVCTDPVNGNGMMYRVDMATGRAESFFTTAGGILSQPTVVSQTVYVGTTLNNVYALNASGQGSSAQLWVYPPPRK
jgi:outer membrane protein assembly factor BamB